ncbi:MAG: acyl-CoA thioesterase/BAAT N-terminal domain-containing protein [Candidatus Omnitrophica bacterium]|nr:acyl-CoA thioesterase/BAAT N-terminal domain-containing protein [Candidatus Omnitrophota bacterium]
MNDFALPGFVSLSKLICGKKPFLGFLPVIFSLSSLPAACDEKLISPQLIVSPRESLVGEPIIIKVTGLKLREKVSLSVEGKDQYGNIWSSSAWFASSRKGIVDTSLDASIIGSNSGVDSAGLFWSMKCIQKANWRPLFLLLVLLISFSELTTALSRLKKSKE